MAAIVESENDDSNKKTRAPVLVVLVSVVVTVSLAYIAGFISI